MSNINNPSQNFYSVPEVQELSTLDPLFEEISDDKSASLTGGARGDFAGTIPSIGSKTFPEKYTTTPQFNDIVIRVFGNPYDLYVKAVRADGKGDVSKDYTFIPANSHDKVFVARNVKDGTDFKLNFNAPTVKEFSISGPITY